jgi:polyisoprenyl-phosphate glycosyltransferase
MHPYISVVIPVFNSYHILDSLYTHLTHVLVDNNWAYEIVLIDDGSTDGSFERMKELHTQDTRVKVIELIRNFGQQNAIMCGLHHTKGEYIITMDDDLQNPPDEIEKLMQKILSGYDVVYGIPEDKKHPFMRKIGTKMTDWLFNIICNKPRDIKVSSFRVMTRHTVEKVIQDRTSFVYLSAILFKNQVKFGNVTVRHDKRSSGSSNYSIYRLIRLFVNLYIYYSPLSYKKVKSSSPQFIIKSMLL